jgi:hypothetical protein
VKDLKQERRVA